MDRDNSRNRMMKNHYNNNSKQDNNSYNKEIKLIKLINNLKFKNQI